jgi:hypothetical protein
MSRRTRQEHAAAVAALLSWFAVAGCFFACGNSTSGGGASASGGTADGTGGVAAGRGSGESGGSGGVPEQGGSGGVPEQGGTGGTAKVSGGASNGGVPASTGGIAGGLGGDGGDGAVAGAGAGAGAAGAPSCVELNKERQTWLDAARTCSPELNGQCAGARTVPNQCGCPTLVNSAFDYQVKRAQAAYDAWVAANCGPYACGAACFVGTMGVCDPTRIGSSTCIWQ